MLGCNKTCYKVNNISRQHQDVQKLTKTIQEPTSKPSVLHFFKNRDAFLIFPQEGQSLQCSFSSFDVALVIFCRHSKHQPWEHVSNTMTALKIT